MLTVQSFTFNPLQEQTYIVYNDKGLCCIIDPGCYFASEEEQLKQFIIDKQLKPSYLLNTHCHLDHVFGNQFVHRLYGLSLHLHKLEQSVLDYASVTGEMWQLPFVNYSGPVLYLQEDSQIHLDGDTMQVLLTPGHSPGSISFYSAMDGFVISGDVLFKGSIGRTDFPGSDFQTLKTSIQNKLYTLPGEVTVYPGHGGPTSISAERIGNPFVRVG